jgi:hypothetical protein
VPALKKKNFSADYKSHWMVTQRKISAAEGIFPAEKFSIGRIFFRAEKKFLERGKKEARGESRLSGSSWKAEGESKFGVWQWGGVSSE